MSEERLWTWREDDGPPPAAGAGKPNGRAPGPPRRPDDGGRALAAARAAGPIVTDRIDPEVLPAPPATIPAGGAGAAGIATADEDGAAGVGVVPTGRARWGQTWRANLGIERALAAGMFACIAWSLTAALRSGGMRPSQTVALFLLASFFFGAGIVLGGQPGGRNYRRYTDYGLTDWFLLLIPLLLLVRLLPSALEGPGALARDVSGWIADPVRFWDAALAWGIIILFFVWDAALSVAQNLATLSFQTAENSAGQAGATSGTAAGTAAAAAAELEWERSPYRFADHAGAWRHLMRLFIFGGCLVLLFTGLSLVRPESLGNPERPEVTGVLPGVLLYFLLGLMLASQTSLDRLRAGWLRGGVDIQPGLARRWLGYSGALMGLGLVLALLLPTSFSDRAADQLPLLWRWLWFVQFPLTFVLRGMEWLIGGLAALLFAPFSLLFPRGSNEVGALPRAVGPIPTPLPVEPSAGAPSTLGSRLLWALLLYVLPTALVLYAGWSFWRKRRVIWRDLRHASRVLWHLLREALLDLSASLWRLFSFGSTRLLNLAPGAIRERLRRRRAARAAAAAGQSGWLRLRDLGPRELIQYFYVSLLQRAEGVGWARGKGQTPYEYGRDLADHLPDRAGEVRALTEAYVRARYSPAPVSAADAQRARGPWQRLRDSMQTRRRAGQLASWIFGRR